MMDDNIRAKDYAHGLTIGAQRALLGMTDTYQFASTRTFNPNGAHFLYIWFPDLCEKSHMNDTRKRRRAVYRLTTLGLKTQAYLKNNPSLRR